MIIDGAIVPAVCVNDLTANLLAEYAPIMTPAFFPPIEDAPARGSYEWIETPKLGERRTTAAPIIRPPRFCSIINLAAA